MGLRNQFISNFVFPTWACAAVLGRPRTVKTLCSEDLLLWKPRSVKIWYCEDLLLWKPRTVKTSNWWRPPTVATSYCIVSPTRQKCFFACVPSVTQRCTVYASWVRGKNRRLLPHCSCCGITWCERNRTSILLLPHCSCCGMRWCERNRTSILFRRYNMSAEP